ncbi:MAG TPA: FAD-dependent oxidoreductase [Nocardioidaceae bacterium]
MTTQSATPVPAQSGPNGEEHVDTVIIGAGQTGLATAYHLSRVGVETVVLDENARVGDHWRRRYDSLRLYTPAKYDSLPGMPFPLPPRTWPTGRQMGDYLEQYVEAMGLDVRHGMSVDRVRRGQDGDYVVTCGGTSLRARNVVVATGGEHHPRTPAFAGQIDPGIRQIHSNDYHNPSQLLPGEVLVVGASHSGADLALESAQAGHETWLAGPHRGQIPIDIEGFGGRLATPVLWFAANHVLTTRTPVGRKMRPEVRNHGGPLIRVKSEHLEAAGVHRTPARVTGAKEGLPVLDDGTVLDVRNVIWCTGFRQDFSFIDLPVVGEDGWPLDEGGVVSAAPGLYFVGLLFQRGFYSMLIGGAGRDGAFIASHIAARSAAASRRAM